jgi:hypothetical protein
MKRFYKPLFIGMTGLILVMLAFSVILPSQVMTSKWVRVAQEKDEVIRVLSDLHTWKEWNSLLTGAEGIKVYDTLLIWRTPNGQENSIKLESVEANGVSTPVSLNQGKYINSGFSVEKRAADSVQVVWYIIEELKWYPWEKFYGMMAADMKGPLMQQSLDQLKVYLNSSEH